MNALTPSAGVLIKLGSLAVHVEEMLSDDGHPFDVSAIKALLSDPELQEWFAAMNKLALLLVKRKTR